MLLSWYTRVSVFPFLHTPNSADFETVTLVHICDLGTKDGTATLDRCDVCNGSNTCLDCKGDPNGANRADKCGACDANATNNCRADLGSGLWGGGRGTR